MFLNVFCNKTDCHAPRIGNKTFVGLSNQNPYRMEIFASHPFLTFFIILIIVFICLVIGKDRFDNWSQSSESEAVKSDIDKFKTEVWGIADANDHDPTSLEKSALELREYYTISKRQAKRTFNSAMVACYLGFGMFALAVLLALIPETSSGTDGGSSSQYSAIGGAMVEVIAGLFFWMYTKATTQMKTYYDSLLQTHRHDQAKDLADKLEDGNKEKAYAYIITQMAGGGDGTSLELEDETSQDSQSEEKNDEGA